MSAKPDVYLYGQVLGAHSFLLIASFQEVMHIAATAAVLLSIAALVCLIVAGCRDRRDRGIACGIIPTPSTGSMSGIGSSGT